MSEWEELVAHLNGCAELAGISTDRWEFFMGTVQELNDHNTAHACHSLRVGLYAFGLAQHEHQADLKYPLYAGCAHDVGKCDVLNEVINHPSFGPEQMAVMRSHPQLGFDRLKDRYLYTAFVAGLHHKYQPAGYGIDLSEAAPFPLSPPAKQTIIAMVHLVMICDFYDAITTRSGPNKNRVAETMQEYFPDSPSRVAWLLEQ